MVRRWIVVALAAIAVVPASLPQALAMVAPPPMPVPRVAPRPAPPPSPVFHGRLVAAAGVLQYLQCAGTGPVTVVVIPGLHASHTMWSLAAPGMARVTRTCVYDRPGMGASPPRQPHRTVDAGIDARELWALLVAAKVPGPFVVVGHSYGGLIARALVAQHRASVAAVMLVEGVAPYDRLSRWWSEGGDRVDTLLSSRAAAALGSLGSVPLAVLAAQDPDRSYWGSPSYGSSASDLADWRAHQQAAAALSRDSTYVVVRRAAHVIEHDRPDAVVAATRLLVHAVTTRTWMPRCALAAYGAQPLC